MSLHQQSCNGQAARDRVVVLELTPREELLTMPPERMLFYRLSMRDAPSKRLRDWLMSFWECWAISGLPSYATAVADNDGLSDSAKQTVLSDESIQIDLSPTALGQVLVAIG